MGIFGPKRSHHADAVVTGAGSGIGAAFAIELAASQVDAFGLSDISAQLEWRMGLLDASGPRTAPRHQRSLRGALAWSYDLLSEDERALLRRLSVFAGAFSLADATDLIGPIGPEAISRSCSTARPARPRARSACCCRGHARS